MTIDPRLLNEGVFENSVNQGELDGLENMLFLPTGSSQTAQLEDFATQGHLKDMHNDLSATDFVGLYSTINVSTNTNFAKTWNKLKEQNKDYDGSIEPVMSLGNSRDLPMPFVHHCKAVEGCTFETIVHGHLLTHETVCTDEKVEKLKVMASLDTKFECTYCHQRFKTRRQLRYHVDEAHLWVPKRCDGEVCDSTEVFENSMKFNPHKTKQHTVRFSTRCLFPRCTSSSAYNSQQGYSAHLSRNHGLPTAAEKSLIT